MRGLQIQISSTDGTDSSNIVVKTGGSITLNEGAYLVYSPGYSITKSGGTLNLLGTITKQYLFYYDVDDDQNAANGSYLMSTSSSNVSDRVRGIYNLGTDPYDSNSSANLSATTYFTVHRGDNSYDYNGVSGEEKQHTTIATNLTCTWTGAPTNACSQTQAGVVGWEGSAPACGVSGRYYLTWPFPCSGRVQEDCAAIATNEETITQACR